MNQNKGVAFNSTLLFVVASNLAMTLHEVGHFIAGGLVHAQQLVLHHNNVSTSDSGLTLSQIIAIKAAGPVVSLLIGIVFHIICSRFTQRNLLFLFLLYLSVFGYIGVFGYLMVAPFFTEGDTGYICAALDFPIWLTVSIAIAAGVLLYFIMTKLVRYFVEMATPEIALNREQRTPFIMSLILYPVFIGLVFTTLMNLPIPTWLSLIAPICSPFTILWTLGLALSGKFPTERMNTDIQAVNKIRVVWIIVLILTVAMNRLLVEGY